MCSGHAGFADKRLRVYPAFDGFNHASDLAHYFADFSRERAPFAGTRLAQPAAFSAVGIYSVRGSRCRFSTVSIRCSIFLHSHRARLFPQVRLFR